MTHLSPSEFVDVIEGSLPAGRAGHLDACHRCRAQAEQVRSARRESMAIDMPEPSPLFWEHLSARVREAVATEPRLAPSVWARLAARRPLGLVSLAAAVALVLVAGSGAWLARGARPAATPSPVAVETTATTMRATGDSVTTMDGEEDAVWAVLSAAAADMKLEEAHAAGMGVHPGAIDRAVLNLSPEERNELGRLLQSELKRSGN